MYAFTVFDGSVTGMNLYSLFFASTFQVKLTFEEPEPGVTIFNLTHTDVPEEDRAGTHLCHLYKSIFDRQLKVLKIHMMEDMIQMVKKRLDINLERLRMAVDGLILKLAKLFPRAKQQIVFLINNYNMTIAVLKEAGPEDGKIQMHFEELLKSNTSLFVEE